jgi:hypothetical protein
MATRLGNLEEDVAALPGDEVLKNPSEKSKVKSTLLHLRLLCIFARHFPQRIRLRRTKDAKTQSAAYRT